MSSAKFGKKQDNEHGLAQHNSPQMTNDSKRPPIPDHDWRSSPARAPLPPVSSYPTVPSNVNRTDPIPVKTSTSNDLNDRPNTNTPLAAAASLSTSSNGSNIGGGPAGDRYGPPCYDKLAPAPLRPAAIALPDDQRPHTLEEQAEREEQKNESPTSTRKRAAKGILLDCHSLSLPNPINTTSGSGTPSVPPVNVISPTRAARYPYWNNAAADWMSMAHDNAVITQLAMQSPYIQSLGTMGTGAHILSGSFPASSLSQQQQQHAASSSGTNSGYYDNSVTGPTGAMAGSGFGGAYVPPYQLRSPNSFVSSGNSNNSNRGPSHGHPGPQLPQQPQPSQQAALQNQMKANAAAAMANALRNPYMTHNLGGTNPSPAQLLRSASIQSLQLTSPSGEGQPFPGAGSMRPDAPLQLALVPPAGRTPMPMYIGEYILESSANKSPQRETRSLPCVSSNAHTRLSKSSYDGSALMLPRTSVSSASLSSQNYNAVFMFNYEQQLKRQANEKDTSPSESPPMSATYTQQSTEHRGSVTGASSFTQQGYPSAYYQPLYLNVLQTPHHSTVSGEVSNESMTNNSIVHGGNAIPAVKGAFAAPSFFYYTPPGDDNSNNGTLSAVNALNHRLPLSPSSEANESHKNFIADSLCKSQGVLEDMPLLDHTARPRTVPTKIIDSMMFADDSPTQAQRFAHYMPPPLPQNQQVPVQLAAVPSATELPTPPLVVGAGSNLFTSSRLTQDDIARASGAMSYTPNAMRSVESALSLHSTLQPLEELEDLDEATRLFFSDLDNAYRRVPSDSQGMFTEIFFNLCCTARLQSRLFHLAFAPDNAEETQLSAIVQSKSEMRAHMLSIASPTLSCVGRASECMQQVERDTRKKINLLLISAEAIRSLLNEISLKLFRNPTETAVMPGNGPLDLLMPNGETLNGQPLPQQQSRTLELDPSERLNASSDGSSNADHVKAPATTEGAAADTGVPIQKVLSADHVPPHINGVWPVFGGARSNPPDSTNTETDNGTEQSPVQRDTTARRETNPKANDEAFGNTKRYMDPTMVLSVSTSDTFDSGVVMPGVPTTPPMGAKESVVTTATATTAGTDSTEAKSREPRAAHTEVSLGSNASGVASTEKFGSGNTRGHRDEEDEDDDMNNSDSSYNFFAKTQQQEELQQLQRIVNEAKMDIEDGSGKWVAPDTLKDAESNWTTPTTDVNAGTVFEDTSLYAKDVLTPFVEPVPLCQQSTVAPSIFFSDSVITATEGPPPPPLADPLSPLTPSTHRLINMFDQKRTEEAQREWRKKQKHEVVRRGSVQSLSFDQPASDGTSLRSGTGKTTSGASVPESELYHWSLKHFVDHFTQGEALREQLDLRYPHFLHHCRQKEAEVALLQSAIELISKAHASRGEAHTDVEERGSAKAVLSFLLTASPDNKAEADIPSPDEFPSLLDANVEGMLYGSSRSSSATNKGVGMRRNSTSMSSSALVVSDKEENNGEQEQHSAPPREMRREAVKLSQFQDGMHSDIVLDRFTDMSDYKCWRALGSWLSETNLNCSSRDSGITENGGIPKDELGATPSVAQQCAAQRRELAQEYFSACVSCKKRGTAGSSTHPAGRRFLRMLFHNKDAFSMAKEQLQLTSAEVEVLKDKNMRQKVPQLVRDIVRYMVVRSVTLEAQEVIQTLNLPPMPSADDDDPDASKDVTAEATEAVLPTPEREGEKHAETMDGSVSEDSKTTASMTSSEPLAMRAANEDKTKGAAAAAAVLPAPVSPQDVNAPTPSPPSPSMMQFAKTPFPDLFFSHLLSHFESVQITAMANDRYFRSVVACNAELLHFQEVYHQCLHEQEGAKGEKKEDEATSGTGTTNSTIATPHENKLPFLDGRGSAKSMRRVSKDATAAREAVLSVLDLVRAHGYVPNSARTSDEAPKEEREDDTSHTDGEEEDELTLEEHVAAVSRMLCHTFENNNKLLATVSDIVLQMDTSQNGGEGIPVHIPNSVQGAPKNKSPFSTPPSSGSRGKDKKKNHPKEKQPSQRALQRLQASFCDLNRSLEKASCAFLKE